MSKRQRLAPNCSLTISLTNYLHELKCSTVNAVTRTLRIAGLKLCASLRRELRSCWKPWSSGGEAWWTPAGTLVPTDPDPEGPAPCCCRRHTLVLITNRRSHKSNWTTWREAVTVRTETGCIFTARTVTDTTSHSAVIPLTNDLDTEMWTMCSWVSKNKVHECGGWKDTTCLSFRL